MRRIFLCMANAGIHFPLLFVLITRVFKISLLIFFNGEGEADRREKMRFLLVEKN